MSKVVKKITRPIGKVLTAGMKFTAKIIEKTVPGGKKIVSKLRDFHHKVGKKVLRAVAVAAAVYFTGGAALGAIGTIGTSTSVLSGAMSGLSASWAGVTGAGSALVGTATKASGMATGLTGAANALGAGWAGAAGAGAAAGLTGAAATAAAGQAGLGFGSAISTAATNLGKLTGLGGGSAPPTVQPGPQAIERAAMQKVGTEGAKQGILMTAAKNPLVQQAVVQGVGGMAKGAMQAKAANDADRQRQLEDDEARRRYSANIGGRINIFDRYMSDGNLFDRPNTRG